MLQLAGYEEVDATEGHTIISLVKEQLRVYHWRCDQNGIPYALTIPYYSLAGDTWGKYWRVLRSAATIPQIVISHSRTPYDMISAGSQSYRQQNWYLTLDSSLQTITSVKVDTIGYDRRVTVNLGTVVDPNMVTQIQPGTVETLNCPRF